MIAETFCGLAAGVCAETLYDCVFARINNVETAGRPECEQAEDGDEYDATITKISGKGFAEALLRFAEYVVDIGRFAAAIAATATFATAFIAAISDVVIAPWVFLVV